MSPNSSYLSWAHGAPLPIMVSAPARRTTFLLVLCMVFWAPLMGRAQTTPPRIERVLQADSLRVVGSSIVWRMRYLEVDAPQSPWVEVEDPYGGRIYIPSLYYLSISSDLTAFIEDRMLRSVFFVRRAMMFPAALVFVIGLITLVAFPFASYRRRLRQERERRRNLNEVKHQLAEGREAERLQLARDLHDGPIQDLYATRMRLSMLTRVPAGSSELPTAASKTVDEMVEEIQRVIRVLRGVSEDLRPPALAPFGLAAALKAFVERFRRIYPSIDVYLELDNDEQKIPDQVRLALFRIAQEAMNNAARHGAPSQIGVVLRLDEDRVLLSISDDGRGYHVPDDFSRLGRDGHYGLLGMAERAEAIGAELRVESYPGEPEPTRVRVLVHRSTNSGLSR